MELLGTEIDLPVGCRFFVNFPCIALLVSFIVCECRTAARNDLVFT